MLKQKFDRLASENKNTGDPFCPSNSMTARIIGQSILVRAVCQSLGICNESEDSDRHMNNGED